MGHPNKLRLAGAIAMVAVVACIAPAAAFGAGYTGTFPDGGSLGFKTVTRGGKIVRVKEFAWRDVPVTCKQGPFTYTAQLPYSIRVVKGLFSIQTLDGSVTQSVSGRFTNQRRRANGTLNVYGLLGLGETNCSTGKLTWSAVRR